MLFNHLKYKHLPVCNHPPARLVVSKVFRMNLSTELVTWIMNYEQHVFRMSTPPAPPSWRMTVTFRAWWLNVGRGGNGVWGIGKGGVGNNAVLSVLSHARNDILGIDKDLNMSCGRYSV